LSTIDEKASIGKGTGTAGPGASVHKGSGDGPTATVIVCTYNRVQWLSKCLRSLEEQVPRPDEIMVVDGPSTDGTREMLELLERQGSITLVRQPKLDGISAARNLGLSQAKGEIVCYIDDDAIAQPGWLASLLPLYRDPQVGGAGGPVYDIEGRPAMGRNAVAPDGQWFDESKGESIEGLSQVMVGCNMSFRRAALSGVGGFDPYFKFHQDETDACLAVLGAGYKILYDEGALVWHAWCEGSYRKDKVKWYLRLRYLWGRNNSYLVRKHFGKQVRFADYFGSRFMGFFTKRAPRADVVKKEAASDTEDMPRFFVAVGALSEAFGLLKGWKDGGSARRT